MTTEASNLDMDLRGVTDACMTACGGAAFVSPVSRKILIFNGLKPDSAELLAKSFASENRISHIAYQANRLWALAPEDGAVQAGTLEIYNPWMPCRPLVTVEYERAGEAIASFQEDKLVVATQKPSLDVWTADPTGPELIASYPVPAPISHLFVDSDTVYALYTDRRTISRFRISKVQKTHDVAFDPLDPATYREEIRQLDDFTVPHAKGAKSGFVSTSGVIHVIGFEYHCTVDRDTGATLSTEHLLDQHPQDIVADLTADDGVYIAKAWANYEPVQFLLQTRKHVALATPRGVMAVDRDSGRLTNKTEAFGGVDILPCRNGYPGRIAAAVSNDGKSYVIVGWGRCEPSTADGDFASGFQVNLWQEDAKDQGPVAGFWLPGMTREGHATFDQTGRWLFVFNSKDRLDTSTLDPYRDDYAALGFDLPKPPNDRRGCIFVFRVGQCGAGMIPSHVITPDDIAPDLVAYRSILVDDQSHMSIGANNDKVFLCLSRVRDADNATVSESAILVARLDTQMNPTGEYAIHTFDSYKNAWYKGVWAPLIAREASGDVGVMLVSFHRSTSTSGDTDNKDFNYRDCTEETDYNPAGEHPNQGNSTLGWAARAWNNSDGVSSPANSFVSGFTPVLSETNWAAQKSALGITNSDNYAIVLEGFVSTHPFHHLSGQGHSISENNYNPLVDSRTDYQKWMDELDPQGTFVVYTNMQCRIWVNGVPLQSQHAEGQPPEGFTQAFPFSAGIYTPLGGCVWVRVELWTVEDIQPHFRLMYQADPDENIGHQTSVGGYYLKAEQGHGREERYLPPVINAKPWLGITEYLYQNQYRVTREVQADRLMVINGQTEVPEDFSKFTGHDWTRYVKVVVLETSDDWETIDAEYPLYRPPEGTTQLEDSPYHAHISFDGNMALSGVVSSIHWMAPAWWGGFNAHFRSFRMWERPAKGQSFTRIGEWMDGIFGGEGVPLLGGANLVFTSGSGGNSRFSTNGWNWWARLEQASRRNMWPGYIHTGHALDENVNNPGEEDLPYTQPDVESTFFSSPKATWGAPRRDSPYPRWVDLSPVVPDIDYSDIQPGMGQPEDDLLCDTDGSVITFTEGGETVALSLGDGVQTWQ